jgi:hypothetical protein
MSLVLRDSRALNLQAQTCSGLKSASPAITGSKILTISFSHGTFPTLSLTKRLVGYHLGTTCFFSPVGKRPKYQANDCGSYSFITDISSRGYRFGAREFIRASFSRASFETGQKDRDQTTPAG